MLRWIFLSICFFHVTSPQEATMTCSRTSDTFQLTSTLPPALGSGSARCRTGKQGPKGQKGDMGLKGAKGESPQQDTTSRDQIAELRASLEANVETSMNLLRQINTLRERLASLESGWFNGRNGFQYKLTPRAQSWSSSRGVCQSMGGDLAVVGMMNQTRRSIADHLSIDVNVWIGLSDVAVEGSFKWIDGTDSTSENTHWYEASNEPNGGTRENCVEMFHSRYQHLFNDALCSIDRKGLCEKPLAL